MTQRSAGDASNARARPAMYRICSVRRRAHAGTVKSEDTTAPAPPTATIAGARNPWARLPEPGAPN
jgi:hypothetical protein